MNIPSVDENKKNNHQYERYYQGNEINRRIGSLYIMKMEVEKRWKYLQILPNRKTQCHSFDERKV